tara:strand:+ start:1142 stop:2206 length:1065 start_codon:yes stop_codon:yes gene_type:complete
MLFKLGMMGLGIAVVIFVMSMFGFDLIITELLAANLLLILLAAALQILTVAIMAFRLKVISGNCDIFQTTCHILKYRSALKITLIGIAVNSLTPFVKIGGEPAKIWYLRKKGFPTEKAGAVIATDTLIELMSIYLIILISVIVLALSNLVSASTMILLIGGLAFSLAIFAFIFYTILNKVMLERTINFIVKLAGKLGMKKSMEKGTKKDYAALFQNAMKNTFERKKDVTKYFAISFISKAVEFLRTWVIFLALGVVLPFEIIIFVWSIVMILSLVPWLPGNLGLIEAGGASAFMLFGVVASTAATGMIIERLLSLWLMMGIGLVIIWMSKINKIEKLVTADNHTPIKKIRISVK